MRRGTILLTLVVLCACLLLAWRPVPAQEPDPDENLVLRTYRLSDVLAPWPADYPYSGGSLPTVSPLESIRPGSPPAGGGMGGMGMGGMGGMGGGMGGGGMGGGGMRGMGGGMGMGFSVAPEIPSESPPVQGGGGGRGGGMAALPGGGGSPGEYSSGTWRFTAEDLVQAIQQTVEPESWEDMGGPATCVRLGDLLLIRQTEAAHKQIEQLLAAIVSDGGSWHCVQVVAHWLMLGAEQLAELSPATRPGAGSSTQGTVDPEVLEQLAAEVPGYRGRIVCFNGQMVHLVSGHRRTVVIGAIPVVGSGVGYQPLSAYPNLGVLLQVRPSLMQKRDAAVVDLQSIVTVWDEPGERLKIVSSSEPQTDPLGHHSPASTSSVSVDRPNIATHQLATTLRVPLGKPVLIGGLSAPSAVGSGPQAGEGASQLYLILEVGAWADDKPKAADAQGTKSP